MVTQNNKMQRVFVPGLRKGTGMLKYKESPYSCQDPEADFYSALLIP